MIRRVGKRGSVRIFENTVPAIGRRAVFEEIERYLPYSL